MRASQPAESRAVTGAASLRRPHGGAPDRGKELNFRYLRDSPTGTPRRVGAAMLGGTPDGSQLRLALRAQLRSDPSGRLIPHSRSVSALPMTTAFPSDHEHEAGARTAGWDTTS